MPIVFGPTITIPASRAFLTSSSSKIFPSEPTSLNPDVMIKTLFMPFSLNCGIRDKILSAGTVTTARSTDSGISATDE